MLLCNYAIFKYLFQVFTLAIDVFSLSSLIINSLF